MKHAEAVSLTKSFDSAACRAKVSRAKVLIAKHKGTIAGLQTACPHREATYTEHFWREYHCPTCDWRWTVDVPKDW